MNIGFVSTRFSGTDGVSLETLKWAEVLESQGHSIYWYSGLSDRPPATSMCIPEAFFGHPEIEWIAERVWGCNQRAAIVSERINEVTNYLKSTLKRFVDKFEIDCLVPENALTIPVNIPLGKAITEFLAETNMPAVAHHHDFYWERQRFSVNAIPDLLDTAFPPRLPNLRHACINQQGQEQLSLRKGVSSTLVPNVFKFDSEPPPAIDTWSADVREELGLAPDDIFVLQPTRIVPRKGIEHAIKLIAMLNNPKLKLIISHNAGDEGYEYQSMLEKLASDEGVDLRIIGDRVSEHRQYNHEGQKMYTLWDIYPHADLVTYPSLYEGFGNALLEAFYFKKPVLINRYSVYIQDIKPKGFQLIEMDGYVTHENVAAVKYLLDHPELQKQMVETNYELARTHYGYEALRTALTSLFPHTV